MSETLYLIAHVAEHLLAFASGQIESVVDLDAITPVPRAAAPVVGLAALRSKVVTVIDTRSALGLDPAPVSGSRAVIVAHAGHHYALLVDTLDDVAPFAEIALDRGVSLAPGWEAAARGLIERDGRPVLVIDPTALIPGGSAETASVAQH